MYLLEIWDIWTALLELACNWYVMPKAFLVFFPSRKVKWSLFLSWVVRFSKHLTELNQHCHLTLLQFKIVTLGPQNNTLISFHQLFKKLFLQFIILLLEKGPLNYLLLMSRRSESAPLVFHYPIYVMHRH